MKIHILIYLLLIVCVNAFSANQFVVFQKKNNSFPLVQNKKIVNILLDSKDQKGINLAVENMQEDCNRVFGLKPHLMTDVSEGNCIIVGSLNSVYVQQLIKKINSIKKSCCLKMRNILLLRLNNLLRA